MNKTFDIKRLGMVMRWDFLTLKKHYASGTVGCIISFVIYSLVWLNTIRGWNSAMDMTAHYFTQESIFYTFLAFTTFYVMASCIFTNLKKKTYRESFLMLPANNLEKFMARFLMMGLFNIVSLACILIVTDVIQLAFSYILNPGFHVSISLPVMERILDTPMFTRFGEADALLFSFLIFAHSFCTLGGTFYRKRAPLLTFVTALVLFMVLGYALNWINDLGIFHFHITFSEGTSYLFTTVICIILLILSVFNYWASYKIFTRMQVTCNKWINI